MNIKESMQPQLRKVKRAERVRERVRGSAERPRLSVYRSLRHLHVQIIDDDAGRTLLSCSTVGKDIRDRISKKKKNEQAKMVGEALASKAKSAGITKIVFDRNGRRYIGRIKALADALRAGGLEF